jgi:hypothetical protein
MSGKIVSYKDYVAGWLDSSIHDFLQILAPSDNAKFALITCVDSNSDPASMRSKSPELKSLGRNIEIVGTSLLMPANVLLQASIESQIFFGFDEIWFFPTRDIQPKPASASIVGPARLTQARLRKIGKWMADNTCALGLGGGDGLNFVVPARGLPRFLLGCSIEQPESDLVLT